MKSMIIVVPIMGGLIESKPFWGCLLNSVVGPVDLMVIDNGADIREDQAIFFGRFIKPFWPGVFHYKPQQDNLGMIESLQVAYEQTSHDIIAYMHNDLFIYQRGWDTQVREIFDREDKVGLVGLFGSLGLHQNTGRMYVKSNMLEAEIHGERVGGINTFDYEEIAILDGMSMFASRAMLDERSGVDRQFKVHHFYDLDLSLESLDRGYRNFGLWVPIHHQSGNTACRPVFQEWANRFEGVDQVGLGQDMIYEKNKIRFITKWQDRLPYLLGKGWGSDDV